MKMKAEDVKKFKAELDEVLEAERILNEKKSLIGVMQDFDKKVLYFYCKAGVLLHFAKHEDLPCVVSEIDSDYLSKYRVIVHYDEFILKGFFSEEEYQHYAKEGLLP